MSKSSSHNLMIILLVIIIFVLAYMVYKHKKQEEKFRYIAIVDKVVNIFNNLVEKIKNMAVNIFNKAINPALNYVVGALSENLIRIIGNDNLIYVCSLKNGTKEVAYNYFSKILNNNIQTLFQRKVLKGTKTVGEYIGDIYNNLTNAINKVVTKITAYWDKFSKLLKTKLENLAGSVGSFAASSVLALITPKYTTFIKNIQDKLKNVRDNIIVITPPNKIEGFGNFLVDKITDYLLDMASTKLKCETDKPSIPQTPGSLTAVDTTQLTFAVDNAAQNVVDNAESTLNNYGNNPTDPSQGADY